MKKSPLLLGLSFLLTVFLLMSCGTAKTVAEKQQDALLIKGKVETFDFRFNANKAFAEGKTIHLNHSYNLTVSKDTVRAFLPFYGRLYSAPIDPSENGIKFISTDFDYQVVAGKRPGTWTISIKTADTGRSISLRLNVSDNGSAQLSVTDPTRAAISFDGFIE